MMRCVFTITKVSLWRWQSVVVVMEEAGAQEWGEEGHEEGHQET